MNLTPGDSHISYRTYVAEQDSDTEANTLVCLIHQTNYLLDQQLRQLEERFLSQGAFTERLYQKTPRFETCSQTKPAGT